MTTLGLKNINMLSKEQYDTIAEPVKDELYAISGSGFGFPSDRYDDLELGASGSSYTAPANGYFFISKSGSSGQYVKLTAKTMAIVSVSNGGQAIVYLPVKKGAEVRVDYNLSGATNAFRFIYAEGEN